MRIPSTTEFVTIANDLDMNCAWENFGGLTVQAASDTIKDDPLNRMEDFLHMSSDAFNFYCQALVKAAHDTETAEDEEFIAGLVMICEHWFEPDSRIAHNCKTNLRETIRVIHDRQVAFSMEYRDLADRMMSLLRKT